MITFAPFPETHRRKRPRPSRRRLRALFIALAALSGLAALWTFLP